VKDFVTGISFFCGIIQSLVMKLKNLLFPLFIAALAQPAAYAQTTITLWSFDDGNDGSTSTGTLTPIIGAGTAATIGGVTHSFSSGYPSGSDNSGWQTTTYPAQSTGDKTAGTEYSVSTVGYRDVTLSFVIRHSNTAANAVMVQYSTDGTNFNDFQYIAFTPAVTGTGDAWHSRFVDFSSVPALDNNPNAKFRVVTTYDNIAGTYLASKSTSTYAGGTMRYDSVLVAANGLFEAVPDVSLSVSATSGIETQGTVITVTATAENAVTGAQTIDLNVAGTNITSGDYTLGSTTLTIPDGAASASTTFTVVNDGLAEGNENAVISLANPSSGIALGVTSSANVLIGDNNFPVVSILSDTVDAYEIDTTTFSFRVRTDAPVTGDQEVYLQVTGFNVANYDYTISTDTVIIPNGDTVGYATFTAEHDAYYEGNATEVANVKITGAGPSLNIGVDSILAVTIHNDLSNQAAIISADSSKTTKFLRINPLQNPLVITGSISDTTDPARKHGIVFVINDPDNTGTVTATVSSSNPAVVPASGLVLTNVNDTFTLKITPAGVGLSTITLNANDGQLMSDFTINYAASGAATDTGMSRFHTLSNEASTVIALDNDYMLVANDEDNILRVYDRNESGAPVKEFNMSANLGLNDKADIEGSARVANRIYWVSSHSNSGSGAIQPNRRRLFATDVAGTGVNTTLTYVGRYDSLRDDLIAWDANNGHGLGANHYGFAAATQPGVGSEDINSNGFNIEGLVMAPNNTTAYLCFRAPIVPPSQRQYALIVPVLNFTTLAISNGNAGSAQFGAPIELDLGGRAIRSIDKNNNNEYIIAAGPASSGSTNLPTDFKLFGWLGNPTDAPVELIVDLTIANNTGGSYESIVSVPDNLLGAVGIQLLLDNGDTQWFGTPSSETNHMKFRSDWFTVTNLGSVLPVAFASFNVNECSNDACINWTNASEKQIAHYEIERSLDGKSFNRIVTVAARNQPGYQAYNIVDNLDGIGASKLYYRIKQTSANGTIAYTSVQTLVLESAAGNVSIAPNPATETVTIDGAAGYDKIEITDITGKLFEVISSPTDNVVVRVKNYPVGIYTVTCSNSLDKKVIKLSVTH
jgi:hypothetical protein